MKTNNTHRLFVNKVFGAALLSMGFLVATLAEGEPEPPMEDKMKAIDWQDYEAKRALLTGKWSEPPGGVVNHGMVRGPILGNGDAGVAFNNTTTTSQEMLISKSDFITDDANQFNGQKLDPVPLPIGGVRIKSNAPSGAGYSLEQDILSAEVRLKSGSNPQVSVRNWLAANTNLLVSELATASTSPVDITVEVFANGNNGSYAFDAGVTGDIAWATRQTKTGGIARWTTQAGISTRILGATATVSKAGAGVATAKFSLDNRNKVYVLTCISGGRPNKTAKTSDAKLGEAAAYLNGLGESAIATIDRETRDWWKRYYMKSYVDFSDPLLLKYYYGALYELGSCIRPGKCCPGLYGLWITTDTPSWHSDIHLNYNGQAPFFGLCAANRPEMMFPFYTVIEDFIPEGKRRAKEDLASLDRSLNGKSMRGILYPLGIQNWGTVTDVYLQVGMCASYNVPMFMWHWEYTLDTAFLRDHAYPYARLLADWYEDYLLKEPHNGDYRYYIMGGDENGYVKNFCNDLALVRRILGFLLETSVILNVDEGRRAKWQEILDHLSDYPDGQTYTGTGLWMEVIFPIEQVTLASPTNLLNAARRGLGEDWGQINFFPRGFPAGARMGTDATTLWNGMAGVVQRQLQTNLTIYDGTHGIEKGGGIEMFHSMMLQSVNGVLHLYPVWPPSKTGVFRNLRAKGAFLVSAENDGSIKNVTILSEKGTPCRILNRWGAAPLDIVEYCDGGSRRVAHTLANDIIEFPAKPGAEYRLRSGTQK